MFFTTKAFVVRFRLDALTTLTPCFSRHFSSSTAKVMNSFTFGIRAITITVSLRTIWIIVLFSCLQRYPSIPTFIHLMPFYPLLNKNIYNAVNRLSLDSKRVDSFQDRWNQLANARSRRPFAVY